MKVSARRQSYITGTIAKLDGNSPRARPSEQPGKRYSVAIVAQTAAVSPDLKTSMHVGEWDPTWPTTAVVVVPGLPGWSGAGSTDRVRYPFPNTTTDVVKVLREQGFSVEHTVAREERQIVSLNAAEYWLPVLVFGYDIATNVGAELISGAITQLFGTFQRRRDRLHVRYGNRSSDGTVDFFEAHGPGDDVVKAIRAHGKQKR